MICRDSETINKDVKKVKEAAVIACSLEEVAILTDLSLHQVTVTLSRHPIIKKRVLEQLKENRQLRKQKSQQNEKAHVQVEQNDEFVQPNIEIVFEVPKTEIETTKQIIEKNQSLVTFYSIRYRKIRAYGVTREGEATFAHIKGKKPLENYYHVENGDILFFIRKCWNKVFVSVRKVIDVNASLVENIRKYKIYNEKIHNWNFQDKELNDFFKDAIKHMV